MNIIQDMLESDRVKVSTGDIAVICAFRKQVRCMLHTTLIHGLAHLSIIGSIYSAPRVPSSERGRSICSRFFMFH